jgi:Na+-driven multidrug efflux pump
MSLLFAIGNAACIVVGKAVGDRKPEEAKTTSCVALFLSCIIALIVISILVCPRTQLARFSGNEEVSNMVAGLIPIMFYFIFYIN